MSTANLRGARFCYAIVAAGVLSVSRVARVSARIPLPRQHSESHFVNHGVLVSDNNIVHCPAPPVVATDVAGRRRRYLVFTLSCISMGAFVVTYSNERRERPILFYTRRPLCGVSRLRPSPLLFACFPRFSVRRRLVLEKDKKHGRRPTRCPRRPSEHEDCEEFENDGLESDAF